MISPNLFCDETNEFYLMFFCDETDSNRTDSNRRRKAATQTNTVMQNMLGSFIPHNKNTLRPELISNKSTPPAIL